MYPKSKGIVTTEVVLDSLSNLEDHMPLNQLVHFNGFNEQVKIFLAEVKTITNWISTRCGKEFLDQRSQLFYAIHKFIEEIIQSLKIEPKSFSSSRRESENANKVYSIKNESAGSTRFGSEEFDPLTFVTVKTEPEESPLAEKDEIDIDYGYQGFDNDFIEDLDEDFAVKPEPDEFYEPNTYEDEDKVLQAKIEEFTSTTGRPRRSNTKNIDYNESKKPGDGNAAIEREPRKQPLRVVPKRSCTAKEVKYSDIDNSKDVALNDRSTCADDTSKTSEILETAKEITKTVTKKSKFKHAMSTRELRLLLRIKRNEKPLETETKNTQERNKLPILEPTEGLEIKEAGKKMKWANPALKFNKYRYSFRSKTDLMQRYGCTKKYMLNCNAYLNLNADLTKVLEQIGQHNHVHDEETSESEIDDLSENDDQLEDSGDEVSDSDDIDNDKAEILTKTDNETNTTKTDSETIANETNTTNYETFIKAENEISTIKTDEDATCSIADSENLINTDVEAIAKTHETEIKTENDTFDKVESETLTKTEIQGEAKDIRTSNADGEQIILNPTGRLKVIQKKVRSTTIATFKGNRYHFSCQTKKHQRFYCVKYKMKRCKAQLLLSRNLKTVLQEKGEHNHEANEKRQPKPKKKYRYKNKKKPSIPMVCDQCGKVIMGNGPSALKQHQLTHTDERNYKCKECGNSFKTIVGLNGCIAKHTGISPYVCQYCGRGFSSRGSHRRHEMIHTGERPFCCTYENCGKRFAIKSGLTMHIRVHTKERPYKCNSCERTYPRPEALYLHKRTHLGLSSRPYHKKKPRNTTRAGVAANTLLNYRPPISSSVTVTNSEQEGLLLQSSTVSMQSLSTNNSTSVSAPCTPSFLVLNTLNRFGQDSPSSSGQLRIPNPAASVFVHPLLGVINHHAEAPYSYEHYPDMN